MKNLVTVLLIGLISLTTTAQKVIEKNIDFSNQQVILDLRFAYHMDIQTWDKNEIYFKADLRTKEGKYLDLYELDIDEGANTIAITSNAQPIFEAFHEEWNANNPDKKKRYYNSGDLYEFNYVVYIPKNAKFELSSINGSLTSEIIEGDFKAELINGDIEIKSYAGDLDLRTINGAIDLKMLNADLVAETIHGDIYADEQLKFKSENRHVGQKIEGSSGKGSNRLRLNTINGNMYLRL
ncbi:hypothetical protein FGM00_16815 [Aggregatimonas sangjinii]|uniref:DUF4097 domain-containing protein n=1 Tax=Aggregatimonas sangjinii TaxID=2583587 RepID=A0A5B7SWX9_9FLAO|nr:DUF4097 family beta strand repeat-containing protein [Aggregatimonas sangjinii]QCX01693.1 hypothetical protein FGM00_16815 [Aggregatimonas sangjinii]